MFGKWCICLFFWLSIAVATARGDQLFVPSVSYETIQSAIESANPGDEIVVAPGLYTENLNFRGKAITVRSEDPEDPNVVAATTIEGSAPADPNFGSVVIFNSGEGNDSILEGFTITGGTGSWIVVSWEHYGQSWNRCGGGVLCYNLSAPTIRKNVFQDNIAGQGGGVYLYGDPVDPNVPSDPPIHVEPLLIDNTFIHNSAIVEHGYVPPNDDYPNKDHGDGGAIVGFQGCDAVITNNVILENHADFYGGGIHLRQWSNGRITDNVTKDNDSLLGAGIHITFRSDPVICDNVIQGNHCTGGGGGIYIYNRSDPVVERNLITGNSSNFSVGIGIYYESNPVIGSNVIVRNYGSGIGIAGCSAPFIIASNTISDNIGSGIVCQSNTNPVIEHNIVTGNGNSGSTCYGIHVYATSTPILRYNNVWGNEADNFGPEFTDPTGINGNIGVPPSFIDPDTYDYHLNYDSQCINAGEPSFTGHTLNDYDGESRKMGQNIDIGADEAWPVWNVTSRQGYLTIQAAMDDAERQDKIIVTPGRYLENINYNGKVITVESVDPDNEDITEKTIIDGNQLNSTVTFYDHEDPNTILAGFTITGGQASSYGGGIHVRNGAAPTIRNNIIRDNIAGVKGGGIYYWSNQVDVSVLRDNLIENNVSGRTGGGISCDSGTSVLMINNVIRNNYAVTWGGGVMIFDQKDSPSNILAGNLIVDNECGENSYGGGVCIWNAVATVVNNTIVGNKATYGGGIYAIDYKKHVIANNIVTHNILGDGMYGLGDPESSLVMVFHNDVYGNRPAEYGEGADRTGRNGNISLDPNFVDSGYWNNSNTPNDPNDDFFIPGNYHILPSSPCVDAGEPNAVPIELTRDMDYEPRTFGVSVDMGVDEVITNLSDLNRDGIVNTVDLLILTEEWLSVGEHLRSDLYADGVIDMRDFALLANNWLWAGGWYD